MPVYRFYLWSFEFHWPKMYHWWSHCWCCEYLSNHHHPPWCPSLLEVCWLHASPTAGLLYVDVIWRGKTSCGKPHILLSLQRPPHTPSLSHCMMSLSPVYNLHDRSKGIEQVRGEAESFIYIEGIEQAKGKAESFIYMGWGQSQWTSWRWSRIPHMGRGQVNEQVGGEGEGKSLVWGGGRPVNKLEVKQNSSYGVVADQWTRWRWSRIPHMGWWQASEQAGGEGESLIWGGGRPVNMKWRRIFYMAQWDAIHVNSLNCCMNTMKVYFLSA